MRRATRLAQGALVLLVLCQTIASSTCRAEEIREASVDGADRTINLPYGFWNETFELAAGYVYAINGFPQPQAAVIASVMVGTSKSAMAFAMGQNIRPTSLERLFVDPIISEGYFDNVHAFIEGNPNFPNERAGSNSSHESNYVAGRGLDTFIRMRFKYLLPIGTGRERIVPEFKFEDGLLIGGANGGEVFNPLESGLTFIELQPFYRSQNVDNSQFDVHQSTNGAELAVFYDNRDYPMNPSKGESLRLRTTRDWGEFNSTSSWTSVSAEIDHYISLGATERYRQRVLALNAWTSYSPTWNVQRDGTVENRPPAFSGATLGGLWRMRAFPAQRFNDKAGIYYAAELRMIPTWNPFDDWQWVQQRVGVQWVQFVGFVEAGRVAPDWDFDTLHGSMKWDVGLGVRAWAKGLVVRVDGAYSDEGFGVQMMVGQPFQF